MDTVREKVSLSLWFGAISIYNNISIKLKVEGVVDKDNVEEIEAMIKEGV